MRRAAVAAAALAAGLGHVPARAQVFTVGSDGLVPAGRADAPLVLGGGASDAAAGDADETAPATPQSALSAVSRADAPAVFEVAVTRAAATAGISPALLAAVVWQESRWHADAVSAKGALGLAQLMPATARGLAVDPADVAANLLGGARFLRLMLDRYDGDLERALAAYNAGPARVDKAGGVPSIPETRAYVAAIMGHLAGSGANVTKGTMR